MLYHFVDLFPAHAGMNRQITRGPGAIRAVPRTRWDEPQAQNLGGQVKNCSPHTRG